MLSVRGTGFPEGYLRDISWDLIVKLTQAPEVFAELTGESTVSCVAVGPAWSQEESEESAEDCCLFAPAFAAAVRIIRKTMLMRRPGSPSLRTRCM